MMIDYHLTAIEFILFDIFDKERIKYINSILELLVLIHAIYIPDTANLNQACDC